MKYKTLYVRCQCYLHLTFFTCGVGGCEQPSSVKTTTWAQCASATDLKGV